MGRRKARLRAETASGTRPNPDGLQQPARDHRSIWLAILLVAITIVAYSPVRFCDFVNYDDNDYVTGNDHVKDGLTWNGTVWALTTGHAANWHPLTWMSHMLDVQLFGMNPEPHHLVNVAFHLANTLTLFWLLIELTGAPGRSAFVAALFAVHPLHVESVAWVAERKDVLSTFLWLLTLVAYVSYVRCPRRVQYVVVLLLFTAGLMAKPMLVTLPFVLLLVDFWPLQRWGFAKRQQLPSLIREKIPLFCVAFLSSIVTFLVQRSGRAVIGLDTIPAANRLANAFLSYFVYLERMVWPRDLSVLYPVSATVSELWVVGLLLVVSLSVFAVLAAERWPYLVTGWFWYLGTLIPVIGLIQVGKQASADRYTYIPLIGIFLIIVFGAHDIAHRLSLKRAFAGTGCLAVLACIWLTHAQLQYWQNSQTLWQHALALDYENASAHVNVGSDLEKKGKLDEAIAHYREAVRIEPGMGVAHSNLGAALEHRGELDDAIHEYSEAVRIGPDSAEWEFNLGNALVKTGRTQRFEDAIRHLTEALRQKPDLPEAHNALGICFLTQGRLEKATVEFSEAVRLKPDYGSAHNNLATSLGELGRTEEAISEYAKAVRLDPNSSDAHENLGILLAKKGDVNGAIEHFSAVLRLTPDDDAAKNWLAKLANDREAAKN